jgi:hypothetical protein
MQQGWRGKFAKLTSDIFMDDQRDNHGSKSKRTFIKRFALATMIMTAWGSSDAAVVFGEEPSLMSKALLHSVPAPEYITFQSPLIATVVTVGTDRIGVKPSESTRVTGTTIADLVSSKPVYAKQPWSDNVAKDVVSEGASRIAEITKEAAVSEETLKPFIAPESLADMIRLGSPEEFIVPGTDFETGLSMPTDELPRFDHTRDFATTRLLKHAGIPVASDAVNIQTPGFDSASSRAYSASHVIGSPALSTGVPNPVKAAELADQRARRVAGTQGFEMFAIENLQPPAPEVSLAETELPNISATIHAERLRQLAQKALTDSRSRLSRRATHSAKKYALEALRHSIDIEDAVDGGNHHVRDLRIAQNAIREAKDFSGITTTVDWRAIERMVAAHETVILKTEDLKNVSAVQATESYLDLARTKLISASGRSSYAAESMLLLGMIEKQLLSREDVHSGAVSLVYLGAATEVQPSNAEAHREHGRTLLQQGLADQAIRSLKQSVALKPSRIAYQSLLDASRRSGDYELARQCISALQDPTLFNDTAIVQLPASQFAASYRPTPPTINATPSPSASMSVETSEDPAKEKTRISFRSFFPFGRR